MAGQFTRVAIASRGDAALRCIRAVRELNRERGTKIATIVLYTEPERQALFVREADDAVCLGPAVFVEGYGRGRKSSYLDRERIEQALLEAGVDAVWVGWDLLAGEVWFAELCQRLGILFIGPDPAAQRLLGDKIRARLLAEQAGIPVLPGSGGAVETLEEARQWAEHHGYPLMIKPAHGARGFGIRQVQEPVELASAFMSARETARSLFGDATVFLERMVEGAYHVEAQVMADRRGTVWITGLCDSTAERRFQKILVEAPPPMLPPPREREAREFARRLCESAGYQSAGSVEFLYDAAQDTLWFLEFNAHLGVNSAVTEATTGLDLVKMQLDVAQGACLEGEPPVATGHAVQAHLYAYDPDNGFAPSAGVLDLFRLAGGPGARIDRGFSEGDPVSADLDPLLAKCIAWGRNRQEAYARLDRMLVESAILVRGGMHNKTFLLDLLHRPELAASKIDTLWLDRVVMSETHQTRPYASIALLQAAVEVYDAERLAGQTQFFANAARGRPHIRREVSVSTDFRYGVHGYRFSVSRPGPAHYRVVVDGQNINVHVTRLGRFEHRLVCNGRRYRVISAVDGPNYFVEVDGIAHRMTRLDGGVIRAPAPAVVVSIAVAPGDTVEAGDRLAVVETMKMEMAIAAPFSGRVAHLFVTGNAQVDPGAPLVQLEPLSWGSKPARAERVRFDEIGRTEAAQDETASELRSRVLEGLRNQVLGYDNDAQDAKRLLKEQRTLYATLEPGDRALFREENEILAIFADICLLFRQEMDPAEDEGEQVHSAEQDVLTYLHLRNADRQHMPRAFLRNLLRALAHYDVQTLEPSPQLDESLLLIYTSHQQAHTQLSIILAILERHLEQSAQLSLSATDQLRKLLERLYLATKGRYPAVSDLVRTVHFRFFDEPFFERIRNEVYTEVQTHLAYLAEHPNASDLSERMNFLVECTQPLQNLLTRQFPAQTDRERQLMLEALMRRYYRIRPLENCASMIIDGQTFATATYEYENRRISLAATFAGYEHLREAIEQMAHFVEHFPREHDVVIDFYVWKAAPLMETEATGREIRTLLAEAHFARPLRRVVFALSGPGQGLSKTSTEHFTYRSGEHGYWEDSFYRGLHPMIGKRLQLWRLKNFTSERLPSVENVYLFRGVARDNPKDERLFAFTEVRDLTLLRDERGRVTRIPHLELMLLETLAALRQHLSPLPVAKRPSWNRVTLYIWPPLEMHVEEFLAFMQRVWPTTEGLGLQKIVVYAGIVDEATGELADHMLHIWNPGGRELALYMDTPNEEPIQPLSEYRQKVVQLNRRGLVYPYEIVRMLTPASAGTHTHLPPGDFVEYDLDENQHLAPVKRPYGRNKAGIVVGVVRNYTPKYPEGMTRVILLGDPSRNLGSVAEPECRRVNEAIHLAERLQAPVEWFTLSAGAKISLDSGTENMDWVARTLRCIIEFTQAGGEINVIVNGINVGAQPYWNSESTMLMHTRGILIMTPNGAMVLTGKQSLDYSGGVSAEDNYGIGGYERIMGPNGQAQYFAPDLETACQLLLRHYDHTYVMPGERFPRRAGTNDPTTRDVRAYPYVSSRPEESDLTCVGDLFSSEKNASRKRAFDMRTVMSALIDSDSTPLERWRDMLDADSMIVWDAHIGGYPVAMLGVESRPIPRRGFVPGDGPEYWTAGTLFPMSSKKAARAINSASGNRPLVVIANLSGFDGSPESLRHMELEYGAEVGRAITNFKGPIVFCVVSRYHGGSFVVFSKALNPYLEVAAVEGSYASVIGGVPAAAVVFTREVDSRTQADPRVQVLREQVAQASGAQKAALEIKLNEVTAAVRSERIGEVASEFDHIHNVQRAQQVGSIDHVIPPERLRPYLIEALERGIEKYQRDLLPHPLKAVPRPANVRSDRR